MAQMPDSRRAAHAPNEERRHHFEHVEEVPQGWRFLRNEFNDDGYFALYTNAPEGDLWCDHEYRWFELRKVTERRFVAATEWEAVDA